jgi:hypothetical protein
MKKIKTYLIILYALMGIIILFIPLRETLHHPKCNGEIPLSIFSILTSSLNGINIYSIKLLLSNTVFFTPVITVLLASIIKYQHRFIWGIFFVLYSFTMGYLTFVFILGEKYADCVDHNHTSLLSTIVFLDIFSTLFTFVIGIFVLARKK